MNTMQPNYRLFPKLIIGLVAVALVALAAIMLTPSPAPAVPTISWTPKKVTQTVLAGEHVTVPVSFTASEDIMGAVNILVVPELKPYVTTKPTSFPNITVGQSVNLDVIISAPSDTLPKTVEGTIQLKNSGQPPRNFARPLSVVVTISTRDAELPSCSEVTRSEMEVQTAVSIALQGVDDPWGDGFRSVITRVTAELGCTIEFSSSAAALELPTQSATEDFCLRNQCDGVFYCGPTNSQDPFGAMPSGTCLNRACFEHDLCSFEDCVRFKPPCYFSPQSEVCDIPFFDACQTCPSQDGKYRVHDLIICGIASALARTPRPEPELCQGPQCSATDNLTCDPSTSECVPLDGEGPLTHTCPNGTVIEVPPPSSPSTTDLASYLQNWCNCNQVCAGGCCVGDPEVYGVDNVICAVFEFQCAQ